MKRLVTMLTIAGLTVGAAAGESYNFYMISDTHLGAAETYCTDPSVPKKYRSTKDIRRADACMADLKAMFEDMAKKSDSKTRFLVEGGDLIEGGTLNEETHRKVLQDALSLMKSYFKYPICMMKGNHEAFGMGGEKAYREVLLPEIARTAGAEKLDHANYSFTVGDDLFIFLDCYSGAGAKQWEYADKVLSGLKKKPRYVFVGLHCQIIPSHWDQKNIQALCSSLLKYDAVLLCGHCHQNSITVFEKDGKKLVQVTASTCLDPNRNAMKVTAAENTKDQFLDKYRRSIRNRWKKEGFLPEFEREWAPYITDYRYFGGAGYAKFIVSDEGISVVYQSVDLTQPPLTVPVRSRIVKK